MFLKIETIYLHEMDYFIDFYESKNYYDIYNKNWKCGEYLIYQITITSPFKTAKFYRGNVVHNPKGYAELWYIEGDTIPYAKSKMINGIQIGRIKYNHRNTEFFSVI